jgi:hypothetical protein
MGTIVYQTMPVPAFDRHTRRFPAGAVTFGVEYRKLDEATILDAYGPDARAKFGNVAPKGMGPVVEEDGVSVHVFLSDTGEERLRFDCFDDAPHHHLLAPADARNVVIEHDTETLGAPLDWALTELRTNLRGLLRDAGADDAAGAVDPVLVSTVLDAVEQHARHLAQLRAPVLEPGTTTVGGDAR